MSKLKKLQLSTDTKQWLKAAGVRAAKTVSQAAISFIGTSAAMGDVDWKLVISGSMLSGIVSVLMSIKGLPEVKIAEVKTTDNKLEGEVN